MAQESKPATVKDRPMDKVVPTPAPTPAPTSAPYKAPAWMAGRTGNNGESVIFDPVNGTRTPVPVVSDQPVKE